MLTIYDFNNVTAYCLELMGPMLPLNIQRNLEKIAREAGLFIKPWNSEKEIENTRNGVIDVTQSPPMEAIAHQLKVWDPENSGRRFVVHLFYAGSPHTTKNRRRRQEWERNHPGNEEIVEHEFTAGNSDLLTAQQKEEVEQILKEAGIK